MLWYAIHTFSGQENNIKKRIEQMIEREGVQEKFGRIIVPTREVVSTVRGRRHVSVQNAMPTYVFIEMVLDELTQHLVMNINGVTHFQGRSVQGLCGRRRRNHGRQDQDQGHGHCFRSFYACRTFLQPG